MRVVQERNSSNVPTVAYTRGEDLSGTLEGAGGIGGLLARSHGYSSGTWSTHNFYHADGGGNVTYIVNSGQTMAATYKYDPYGRTLSSSGTLASANVYRFSSKEIHPNSGFHYYGYRFYDPNTQRWLNRDPIMERGFSRTAKVGIIRLTGDANQYWFIGNHPLSDYDALGLEDSTTSLASYVSCKCLVGLVSLALAWDAQGVGTEAANAVYGPGNHARNRHRHAALRHCVASAVLAGMAGCSEAECMGTAREDWQTRRGQPQRESDRGKNNNRVGRQCAGCSGRNADHDIWGIGIQRDLVAIVSCCQQAISDGRADTGDGPSPPQPRD